MLFNSYEFIFLFLPLTLLLYISLGRYAGRRVALSWLVGASLFFYGWWNPAYLGLIIGSMLFNYSLGTVLSSHDSRSGRKTMLVFGVSANLALLGYFKYANFFVDNINALAGIDWNIEHIVLPLAISFFTFQQITYLVDTYRGETREYNFLHYALFVTFFPQLIAGPIVHHREMMPQFANLEKRSINYELIAVGLSIFFLGLFKKVAIADSMSSYVTEAFSAVADGRSLSLFEAWRGSLAYTFQLYFDFSAYSDMAVGAAALFGIRLPLNFNSPYKAYSIIEFWQRWHMTLSRFLKDYLYIPLGGNRKGTPRRYLNLMITMLLGGLWHGAGWTFVIWGGLHGVYLVINHAWRTLKKWLAPAAGTSVAASAVARLLTFFVVVIAWVFFRAEDFGSAVLMTKCLLGYGGVAWPESAQAQLGALAPVFSSWGMEFRPVAQFNGFGHIATMFVLLMLVWFAPNVQQLMSRHPAVIDPPEAARMYWSPGWKWGLWTALLAVIAILKLGQVSEFLYFQF